MSDRSTAYRFILRPLPCSVHAYPYGASYEWYNRNCQAISLVTIMRIPARQARSGTGGRPPVVEGCGLGKRVTFAFKRTVELASSASQPPQRLLVTSNRGFLFSYERSELGPLKQRPMGFVGCDLMFLALLHGRSRR